MKKTYLLTAIATAIFLAFSGCSVLNADNKAASGASGETAVNQADTANEALEGSAAGSAESSQAADGGYIPVMIYYQDGDGLIIPVTRKLPKQEGIAKASVYALIDCAAAREEISYYGIYPVLPEGTEVSGISIKNGTAAIDFNGNILNYRDAAAEKNIVRSVVYTLTGFDTITGVEFLLEGKKQCRMKFGTDLSSVFTRSNVMLNTDSLSVTPEMEKIDLYLSKYVVEKVQYMVPLSVEFEKVSEEELPKRVVEYMEEDYSSRKLYSGIVPEAVLLKSSVTDGCLSLYFNAAFRNYGGTARESSILQQLFHSMKQINGVNKLRIFIEDIEANLPEGSDISGGYVLSEQLNNIIDK